MKLTKEEQEKIKLAVQDLEKESSGELVLYLAKNSSDYQAGKWILSSLCGGLFGISLAVMSYLWLLPEGITVFSIGIGILLVMILGFTLGWVSPKLRSSLLGGKYMLNKVMSKARVVFLEKEVFQTVDRTGILIYISVLEHQVVVLGDTGISSVVKPEQWENVVSHITSGIKQKAICGGILNAIADCKKLLLESKFDVKPDDKNELPDEITIES